MYTTVYCVCCVCACTQLYRAVCGGDKQGCLVHDPDPDPGPLSKLPDNEPALRFYGPWDWGLPVLQGLEAVASQRIPLNSRPQRLGLVCIAKTCIPPREAFYAHLTKRRWTGRALYCPSPQHSPFIWPSTPLRRRPGALLTLRPRVPAASGVPWALFRTTALLIWILRKLQIIAVAEKESSVLWPAALKPTSASRG